ncbi:MAG: MOSC domain-containing protein [Pirellulaceae bacterium]|nr:MOSC domain-containing protein [Pirellulaceae bacterium]
MPTIVSLQVAQPATRHFADPRDGNERAWTSAIFKESVSGPVWAGRTNLAGDGQADLDNHGGVDKAVLAYSAEHYDYWRAHLARPDLPHGAFGENLTLTGLDEWSVCIGDEFQAAGVRFQVSQPRQPCWKLSRRWQIADLARQVIANGKSGWYLRVLTEGELAAGTNVELVSRPHPAWTVARASEVMHHRKDDLASAAELAALPELSASWRDDLHQRIVKRGAGVSPA